MFDRYKYNQLIAIVEEVTNLMGGTGVDEFTPKQYALEIGELNREDLDAAILCFQTLKNIWIGLYGDFPMPEDIYVH